MRILLVDDEKDILIPLCEELTVMGYTVTTASDGKEALTFIEHNAYDVVILDLLMPRIDGFAVLAFLKNNYPKTKVIIMSAHSYPEYVEKCTKLGADDFVIKPYDIGDLFNAIEFVTNSDSNKKAHQASPVD